MGISPRIEQTGNILSGKKEEFALPNEPTFPHFRIGGYSFGVQEYSDSAAA